MLLTLYGLRLFVLGSVGNGFLCCCLVPHGIFLFFVVFVVCLFGLSGFGTVFWIRWSKAKPYDCWGHVRWGSSDDCRHPFEVLHVTLV